MAEATNFWDVHPAFLGVCFLLFCAFFPRLTLAFLAVISGAIGITFWGIVGWFFMPRLVVAILATTIYWHTNPVLCVFAWLCMLTGESTEKKIVCRRRKQG